MQLPVKQHRTKTTNRYFNYIYVRMGACTLIHKRTGDDIWKNLFELPLVETDINLSEEEFLSSASFRSLIAEGEVPEVRLVFRNVKHVLSHRVIYANFYDSRFAGELPFFFVIPVYQNGRFGAVLSGISLGTCFFEEKYL